MKWQSTESENITNSKAINTSGLCGLGLCK